MRSKMTKMMSCKRGLAKTAAGLTWILVALVCLLLAAPAHAQTTIYTFYGASSSFWGRSVSGAGDVNGDGFDDLIVGALRDDTVNGLHSGSAWVFSGVDGSVLFTFIGDSKFYRFGISVSGAGDVNADGFADFIVGAYWDSTNAPRAGSARVFSGLDGSILYTFYGDSLSDQFGLSVSGAGDVNADGFDDLIVGTAVDFFNHRRIGYARVFSGADGSVLYTFYGDVVEPIGDRFGQSVSGAGDVNGDGFDDLIVGAELDDNNGKASGSARVFSGLDGTVLFTFNGDSTFHRFGSEVRGAVDVNADGFADLIVSPGPRVFSGRDGSILYNFNVGGRVSGAGDVNGDGFDDIIVGHPFADNNGSNSGSVEVFSGVDGSVLYTLDGDGERDLFGVSVSGAGDVDGDGFADLIVGASGGGPAYARVISGRANALTLLERLVQEVVELNLDVGIDNSLDAKLDAALDALDDLHHHRELTAINVLEAFISAVQAQSGINIPVVSADSLIASAQKIIDRLTGT